MKVEVISKEIINPSSPTPDHLRRYQLSFLDQISPRAYSPFIYYYALNDSVESSNDSVADISDKLKKSLSKALTLFYPLAGRFTDDFLVDCNDEGVPYSEARVVKRQLTDVLKNPVPVELNDLLPFPLDEFAGLPFGVQLNIFGCGGIAIGICLSHRIGDALSCLEFTRSWMAIARGEENKVVPPTFISATLFPPKYMDGHDPSFSLLKKNTIITKRFVFDLRKVEALRVKYEEKTIGENNVKLRRLSKIEVLSAFLWSRYVDATELDNARNFCTIFHPVNIRPRFDLPMPENSFGNYYYYSSMTFPPSLSTSTTEKDNEYGYGLARKIGQELRKIDQLFVEDLQGVEKSDQYFDSLKKGTERLLRGEGVTLAFTSLCRFPLYEADFGCGKPTWVSSADRCFQNIVCFMDNKKGDGIEAYISMFPEEMAKFEVDKEFLSLLALQIK